MHLKHVSAKNFRNFEQFELEPNRQFNILAGNNGQGKTNLLESIYWLATLRPIRTPRIRELVKWGEKSCQVQAEIELDSLVHRLGVSVKDGERHAHREGKKVRSSAYFGVVSVVLFTPDDVGLIRGAPERRRRFMDRAIFTGRPSHLEDFLNYRRALDARNKLLRTGADSTFFSVYEETLASHAIRLIAARSEFISGIKDRFRENLSSILGPEFRCECSYRPNIDLKDKFEVDSLISLWANDRSRDIERGFTQRGPHADDIHFTIAGRSAKSYASQGQQRSMVLSLKLSEIERLEERQGQIPIVLLDDVSSELDRDRNERLFDFLNTFRGQVFITTTDPDFLQINGDRRIWNIEAATLNQMKE